MKISSEEFERLKKAPKAELLEVLSRFVEQPRGRKTLGKQPLTPYERVKRFRERQREQAQAKIKAKARKHR
jgi:hypothetical protein